MIDSPIADTQTSLGHVPRTVSRARQLSALASRFVAALLVTVAFAGCGGERSPDHAGGIASAQGAADASASRVSAEQMAAGAEFHARLVDGLPSGMRAIGFRPELVIHDSDTARVPNDWRIRIPRNFPALRVNAEVTAIVERLGGTVHRAEQDSSDLRTVTMHVGAGDVTTDRIVMRPERRLEFKGDIAFIIDDVGYRSVSGTMVFLDMPYPVTLAVLPNHEGAGARIAATAGEHGKDVMLHLPMEPTNAAIRLEPNTVLTSMTDEVIREATREQLESVPGVVGINNHMGSKATEDPRVMKAVLDVVEHAGLFFLDSRTSRNTVAEELARERGILTGRRNVFIDNEKDSASVVARIREVARIADRDGFAIAIGHDRDQTYVAMMRMLPELERAGYRIARARELMR